MFREAAIFVFVLAAILEPTPAAPKRTIQQLTSIFENSSLDLQYTYVANIGDHRGWTFGFPGFTSGTYSGTFFLEEYRRQRRKNPLNRFLPAFRRIDAGPHDTEGRNPDTAGLEDFPAVFQSLGADPKFRRAQHTLVDRLAWRPALRQAKRLGARRHITLGQLYDANVNHGEDGINRLLRRTNRRAGGTPADGINEVAWLKVFLQTRFRVLRADPVWNLATDRIRVYERLLRDRNVHLRTPMEIDCYNNHFELR